MRKIVLIAHDIRSCLNVGSLLRTADGLGVEKVYLSGYTPYPAMEADKRLPHLAAKINRQIIKTSLGAEKSVDWKHSLSLDPVIKSLKSQGYEIAALEQAAHSMKLTEYSAPDKIALIVGSEVSGIDEKILETVDTILEIPMFGQKESFNVAVSAAIALYHLTFCR